MRIDSHQHYWKLSRGDYGWLTSELAPIYRDFGPADLAPMLQRHGIDGTVAVQAAPTVAETNYLLGLAEAYESVLGVVGWADFEAANAADSITGMAGHNALLGLRPMIQDLPDSEWITRSELDAAFDAVVEADLVFDALVLPRHLTPLLKRMERTPGLRVVVDHAAKPHIASGILDPWRDDIARIAAETDAVCKLSGMVTEAGEGWSAETLKPYVDHLLDTFGPSRLLWGSDWPVCTLAATYDEWMAATDTLLSGLSSTERAAVMGENAARTYGLELSR